MEWEERGGEGREGGRGEREGGGGGGGEEGVYILYKWKEGNINE